MSTLLSAIPDWTEPEMLHVQWLDDGLLVHAITITAPPVRPHTHTLLAVALSAAFAGLALFAAGQLVLAACAALVWLLSAGLLSRSAWALWREPAQLPPRRRLLVELSPRELSWTLMTSDRFSMHHDRKIGIPFIELASPAETRDGMVVRLTLSGGLSQEIPMHGLPRRDAEWLSHRICEAIAASCA